MPTPVTGKSAPAFNLKDQHEHATRLSSFKGRKVLVYFYPKANTPGCTQQSCNLRDVQGDIGDTAIIGISPDKPAAQKKFDDKYGLGFTLLADADHAVADEYGVWIEKNMYGKNYWGVQRSTYLIDPEGKIAKVFPKVQPKQHDDLLLGALAELA